MKVSYGKLYILYRSSIVCSVRLQTALHSNSLAKLSSFSKVQLRISDNPETQHRNTMSAISDLFGKSSNEVANTSSNLVSRNGLNPQ